jgi:hypothetical protein
MDSLIRLSLPLVWLLYFKDGAEFKEDLVWWPNDDDSGLLGFVWLCSDSTPEVTVVRCVMPPGSQAIPVPSWHSSTGAQGIPQWTSPLWRSVRSCFFCDSLRVRETWEVLSQTLYSHAVQLPLNMRIVLRSLQCVPDWALRNKKEVSWTRSYPNLGEYS